MLIYAFSVRTQQKKLFLLHDLICWSYSTLQEDTFQAVLTTDGSESYIIFLYGQLHWGPAVVIISLIVIYSDLLMSLLTRCKGKPQNR